jgi:aspartate/glutamate racemase
MPADFSRAVFLSYASQDAEAAKRICESLRSAGIEVWFDQSELRGGDVWDQKIRHQIKECALFVPIISANTTMEDGFFQSWLKQRYEIETIVPPEPVVRNELQRIIQKELGMGIFKPETKRYVLEQMEALRTQGAEGVILGCTEFPLIIQSADVTYPVFDTTRLHSAMAVDFILRRQD